MDAAVLADLAQVESDSHGYCARVEKSVGGVGAVGNAAEGVVEALLSHLGKLSLSFVGE